jgi:hypothetical protein
MDRGRRRVGETRADGDDRGGAVHDKEGQRGRKTTGHAFTLSHDGLRDRVAHSLPYELPLPSMVRVDRRHP